MDRHCYWSGLVTRLIIVCVLLWFEAKIHLLNIFWIVETKGQEDDYVALKDSYETLV